RFAAQFPALESCAGATTAPAAVPDANGIRCSTGCIGAFERSKPPSEPTPEPSPKSSIGGITARGIPDPSGAGVIPPKYAPLLHPGVTEEAPAAVAKLGTGRAPISAWRIVLRVKS